MSNKDILKEFVRRFEKRCIASGVYPAIVHRQLEIVLDEMFTQIEEDTIESEVIK